MGALYLSCKVGETPKKLRDVCNVFHRIYQRENNLSLDPLDVTKQVFLAMFI